MAHPVIHFEIQSSNAAKVQDFYAKVFDWKIDTNNPMNYGMVSTGGEGGINGGIAPAQGPNRVTFYVQTDDPQGTLDKALSLGATMVAPVMEVPGGPTIALFSDPEGNVVGLVNGM